MFIDVSEGMFIDEFHAMGRGHHFSIEGLRALFEYLEELEGDTGAPIELDVIALCCEFTEYASFEEFKSENGDDYESWECVRDITTVIDVDDNCKIIHGF